MPLLELTLLHVRNCLVLTNNNQNENKNLLSFAILVLFFFFFLTLNTTEMFPFSLTAGKGFWSEMLGVGDFYYELGVQIIEVCLALKHRNGGL